MDPTFSFQAGWAGRDRQGQAGRDGTPSADGRWMAAGWPPDGPRMSRGWQVPAWGRCLAGWGGRRQKKTSKNPTRKRSLGKNPIKSYENMQKHMKTI